MVCINSVTVYPSSATIRKGQWYYDAYASISSDCPECAEVRWYSNNSSIASVNATTGYIYGVDTGTTRVYAEATDGSGKKDYITVTVTAPVSVTGISVSPASKTMNAGDTDYLYETVYPSNATNKTVTWRSSDESVATVNTYTGFVRAKKAGIVIITATTADGGYSDSCEIWVKGKTPVFLIHGRISNSNATWGVETNIPSGANDALNPHIDAEYSRNKKFTDVYSQKIINVIEGDCDNADKPCNLGYELQNAGYKENINLFAFNYPNEDAVVHSARKFKKYVENLIDDVRTSGTDEMKACFYASKCDYDNNNYKINIVGHSMGGLVARYYIENLYQDSHVDKLITICTPHWGSGYGNLSNLTGNLFDIELHVLADHDLYFDSAMLGGSSSTNLNCNAVLSNCYNGSYTLTDELLYNRERQTKYYAIAGIDYDAAFVHLNDCTFEMPTNLTSSQEITDYLVSKNIYKVGGINLQLDRPPDPKDIGDNMVGFLSQIGWIGDNNNANTPQPKIQMEKIFIDVDTNGGNGGGIFIVEILPDGSNIFHSKVNHRKPVCDKVIEFLEE